MGEGVVMGDLMFCGRCLKFKSSAANETFLCEQMILKKGFKDGEKRL